MKHKKLSQQQHLIRTRAIAVEWASETLFGLIEGTDRSVDVIKDVLDNVERMLRIAQLTRVVR